MTLPDGWLGIKYKLLLLLVLDTTDINYCLVVVLYMYKFKLIEIYAQGQPYI